MNEEPEATDANSHSPKVTARSLPIIFRSPEVEAILYDEGRTSGPEYRLDRKKVDGGWIVYFASLELDKN